MSKIEFWKLTTDGHEIYTDMCFSSVSTPLTPSETGRQSDGSCYNRGNPGNALPPQVGRPAHAAGSGR